FYATSMEINLKDISILEQTRDNLKEEYARILISFYKNKDRNNIVLFFLSSKSFNQAYKRLKYWNEFSDYARRKYDEYIVLEEELDSKNMEYKSLIVQHKNSVQLKSKELVDLNREQIKINSSISDLKKREFQLKKELTQQREIAEQLERKIEELLKAELKDEPFLKLTPEQELVGIEFLNNKGILPWPTEYGIITGKYGEHAHPVLKNIKVQNNGIDITTKKNSAVRAIYNGIVKRVFFVPGWNNAVIIRHGNYL
ncbi:murein hydrolase activator EnvC family protein, partial [Bacteroidota bacterium]